MKFGTRLLLPAQIRRLKYVMISGEPWALCVLVVSSNIDQIRRLKYDDFWGSPGFACLSSKINEFMLKVCIDVNV